VFGKHVHFELSEDPISWEEFSDRNAGLVTARGVLLVFIFRVTPLSSHFKDLVVDLHRVWYPIARLLELNKNTITRYRVPGLEGGRKRANVEIITDASVEHRLGKRGSFGVVSSTRKRMCICIPTSMAIKWVIVNSLGSKRCIEVDFVEVDWL